MNKFLSVLIALIALTVTSCTTSEDPEPEEDPNATYLKAKQLSGGLNNFIVLREDETLKKLGASYGSGEDLSGITAIASGFNHTLALKNDGTVWAWGENFYGQVGDSTNNDRTVPKQLYGMTNVIAIAAGGAHSMALKSDGTVWAWGSNVSGEVGDTTYVNKYYPVQILTGVVSIAAGTNHSLAIKSDGTVWGWGDNSHGNLTSSAANVETKPVQLTVLSNITSLNGGTSFSIFLKNDSTVWSCGINDKGQLGTGSTSADINTPVQIAGLTKVTMLSAGLNYSLALRNDSTVWAWGNNSLYSIGDGTSTERDSPVQVDFLKSIKAIASSPGGHSAAIEAGGTVWTWGNNASSQLGESFLSTYARSSPDRVKE